MYTYTEIEYNTNNIARLHFGLWVIVEQSKQTHFIYAHHSIGMVL